MTDLLHYEDFPEGLVIPFGTYHLSKEEVIAYAREWDPQPMHLDEEAAKRSVLGGLAASGWQAQRHPDPACGRGLCQQVRRHGVDPAWKR